jgi:alpha-glucosidase (family GH31 glycosyl hydrolase)
LRYFLRKPPLHLWGLLFFIGVMACYITQFSQAAEHAAPAKERAKNSGSVADPQATVLFGHARFTVLTPQLIRMEWAAEGKFEDHASLVFLNRRLPVPEFTQKHKGQQLTIDTSTLHLTYNANTPDNGKFAAENMSIALALNGKQITWHPGTADTGNLLGTARTLDEAKGSQTKEPMEPGLISRDGWTLVDDSERPLFDSDNFNFTQGEKSSWPWVMERPSGDRQDWYFFGYGHNYKQALHDYVSIAGRIPLPPRFAFGSWWSRYWAYSDQELDSLVNGFRQNNVPLDVLVIDMDWHINRGQLEAMHQTDQAGQRLGWTGYTWNSLLFPDPQAFLNSLHQKGLKATLNLHPASGVQPWEKQYPAMARAMGSDPATGKYVPFDITDKKFATNYMDLLHHPLEQQGIDFWWLDWQQQKETKIPGVNPTWWLNYVHFTDQEREGKRPLLFHRWGGLGNHRYEIGFSGDTVSVWESLAFQPWFTATAANVGYAYWSHDIGGHMPGVIDPELYTRWVQFGTYSPILRTHTTKNPDAERRIWAYPEPFSAIMRDTFQLRYALEPYIYTEARRTYDTGLAFLHPLYYDWPEADAAYKYRGEYVFGSEMIVAPVTKPVDPSTQLAEQAVWIPDGEWIESATGKHFRGPEEIIRSFSIEQVPVYVRAGAIIPMQPDMEYTGQKPVDPLRVNVYPLADGQSTSYTLYEDGSQSEAYKHGICAWTKLSARQAADSLTIEIAPVRGSYPGMPVTRSYEIRLPNDWPPASVTVNGKALTFTKRDKSESGWHYEGNTLTTIISTPRFPVSSGVRIEIRRTSGSLAARPQLDDFAGSITRLRGAYDTVNAMHPVAWSPNTLIEAMQTGDRLSYHPESIRAEISKFSERYISAIENVEQLSASILSSEKQVASNQKNGSESSHKQQISLQLKRAAAELEDGKPSFGGGEQRNQAAIRERMK